MLDSRIHGSWTNKHGILMDSKQYKLGLTWFDQQINLLGLGSKHHWGMAHQWAYGGFDSH